MTESTTARYAFHVRFRLEPHADVSLDPQTFETTLYRPANDPGRSGWLFFRDNLWRGEVNDERHLRDLAEAALGVPVESVTFRELQTNPAYLDALKAAIERELDAHPSTFGNATSVDEVMKNYLGSSVRVQPEDI